MVTAITRPVMKWRKSAACLGLQIGSMLGCHHQADTPQAANVCNVLLPHCLLDTMHRQIVHHQELLHGGRVLF